MPDVMIKKLGPWDSEVNSELICEICNEYRNEEELSFTELLFAHPEDETKMIGVRLNICEGCLHNFIHNSTMNKVKDVFNGR